MYFPSKLPQRFTWCLVTSLKAEFSFIFTRLLFKTVQYNELCIQVMYINYAYFLVFYCLKNCILCWLDTLVAFKIKFLRKGDFLENFLSFCTQNLYEPWLILYWLHFKKIKKKSAYFIPKFFMNYVLISEFMFVFLTVI